MRAWFTSCRPVALPPTCPARSARPSAPRSARLYRDSLLSNSGARAAPSFFFTKAAAPKARLTGSPRFTCTTFPSGACLPAPPSSDFSCLHEDLQAVLYLRLRYPSPVPPWRRRNRCRPARRSQPDRRPACCRLPPRRGVEHPALRAPRHPRPRCPGAAPEGGSGGEVPAAGARAGTQPARSVEAAHARIARATAPGKVSTRRLRPQSLSPDEAPLRVTSAPSRIRRRHGRQGERGRRGRAERGRAKREANKAKATEERGTRAAAPAAPNRPRLSGRGKASEAGDARAKASGVIPAAPAPAAGRRDGAPTRRRPRRQVGPERPRSSEPRSAPRRQRKYQRPGGRRAWA